MSKSEISDPAKVSEDFDLTALDNGANCFGLRRTRNNGTSAKVGSQWWNVWCDGVLDSPDEDVGGGKIMLGASEQPTCSYLADHGRIGVLRDGKCYGSEDKYMPDENHLECDSGNLLPSRIVILNGAAPRMGGRTGEPASKYPATDEAVAALFGRMVANAADQQRVHAGDEAE
jgi:hypothetical protein